MKDVTGNFLVVRRDKETGEMTNALTLAETLDKLVPAWFVNRQILEAAFKDDQVINTPFAQYFLLNGQHDPHLRD